MFLYGPLVATETSYKGLQAI